MTTVGRMRTRTWTRLAAPLVAVAVVVTAGACTGSDPSTADGAATATTAPEPPTPPDEPGPYGVGHLTIEVPHPDRPERVLPVDIWYPAEDDPAAPRTDHLLVGDIGLDADLAVTDAPVADDGPYPLVVFSHGNGGVRTQSLFLTETLASHGFVVASPDHVGNTAVDAIAGTEVDRGQAALDRVADVSVVIDDVLSRSDDPADALAGSVDPDRIGLTGHSFGGLTAMLATMTVPEGPSEPRVEVIAPIAPASFPLSDEQLASITLPTLLVGGTEDTTTPIDPEVTRPWELLGSEDVVRADLDGAGHMAFSEICAITDAFSEAGQTDIVGALVEFSDGACEADVVPTDEVHRRTNRMVVAFLLVELAGDERYEQFLSAEEGTEVLVR